MIKFAERISGINEYYFSSKLREVKTLIDSGKEIINLGIGSPDLMPPISAIENLKSGLSVKNAHKYQSYNGIDRIRLEISRFYKFHYGVDLNYKTDILPLIGSKEGIFHISMAFLSKNDKVLIPNPGYPAYSSITKLIGNSIVYYNLNEKNNWLPDLDELNKHDLNEVKLMWINYPHMPSGSLASISFLKKLVDFAASNNILLVNDNPYSFILNKKPISIMNVEGAMEYCIELNSLSKSFNMAGWRIGFSVGNKEYISNILKVKSNIDSGMFLPLQLGAVSALSESKEWFKSLNKEYQKRRELVWILADKLNCKFSKNTSGMFVWAKISSTNNSKKFVDKLLNEKDIFVAPGVIFGSNGEGYIRISLCNTIENIKKAIKKF
ncbi:aminotransferase class I/II-fold pyridoxal phosphate-dependent enzyme [bacterium]|nr:aminotransferase class I/II-fold pyridoxal phosphate-dependent enzyme [bacterium]